MYTVEFSKLAEKKLIKLEGNVQKRIISSLERIRIRPQAHLKKLVDSPYFSLRVGDYRLILNIQQSELIILVINLGHRKSVYSKS